MSEDRRGSVKRTQISLEERAESMHAFYRNREIANVSITYTREREEENVLIRI